MKSVIIFLMSIGTYLMAQQGPNMFKNHEECLSSFESNKFSYYQAMFFNNYNKNSVNGISRVVSPLTSDAIVDMTTVNGRRWVILPKGEMVRWNYSNGLLRDAYAMDICGNQIFSLSYLIPPTEEVSGFKIHDPPLRNGVDGKNGSNGHDGRDGRDGKDGTTVVSSDNTGWIVAGVVAVVALVYIFWPQEENVPIGTSPGVTTGGVGPGVDTGGAH